MKTRTGFVSNSSSSSFICDVSGAVESGWDMCLSEAEMSECIHGHTFGNNYLVMDFSDLSLEKKRELVIEGQNFNDWSIDDKDEREADSEKKLKEFEESLTDEMVEEYIEDGDFDEDVSSGYGLPEEMCPICSFEHITDNDARNYMLKKLGLNEDELKKEIKNTFKGYKDLQTFLTKKE